MSELDLDRLRKVDARRIEIIGNCVLFNGDCQKIIPQIGAIDAAITDPPYGIEDIVGGYGRDGRTIENDRDLRVFIAALEALRLTQKNCWVMAFYSCRVTDQLFSQIPIKYFGEVIWDKKVPGMGRQIRYQHENIAFFRIGDPPPLHDSFSVIRHPRIGKLHPHEKPVGLMHRLISLVDADIILDPFMGSGTTGVAAVKAGRKFIGIELDPEYFELCCDRIRKAADQPDMFTGTKNPQKQEQESLI